MTAMHEVETLAPDPTIYREEDDVGEHEIQTYILELLRPLVERYLGERGALAHVGSDQFIYWMKHDPTRSLAPDLYVLPGVPQSIAIDVWKVWERGVVPTLALEVVGGDVRKDYVEGPRRYAELGVRELIVFDPFEGRGRVRFQVFRQTEAGFVRVEATDSDRVFSLELGCFLRTIVEGSGQRLRLGHGEAGDELYPTAEEAALAAKDAALAAKDAALAAKDAALADSAALRARLIELETGRPTRTR